MEWSSIGSIAIIMYIFSHELDHLQLNHIGNKSNELHNLIDNTIYNYNQEFEADLKGYNTLLNLIQNPLKETHLNITQDFNRFPLIYLLLIDLLESWELKEGCSIDSKSHPRGIERFSNITNNISFQQTGVELYNRIFNEIELYKKTYIEK